MRFFLFLLPVVISTLAAAGPLPSSPNNALEIRAPFNDNTHTESDLAALSKRGRLEEWWFKYKCDNGWQFDEMCSCPNYVC